LDKNLFESKEKPQFQPYYLFYMPRGI
jgi:hypothetical protein